METKTVLHRLPLYVLVSLAIFMLDSCFTGFNSSEEVMAYLEKNYPGQRIVLSCGKLYQQLSVSDDEKPEWNHR